MQLHYNRKIIRCVCVCRSRSRNLLNSYVHVRYFCSSGYTGYNTQHCHYHNFVNQSLMNTQVSETSHLNKWPRRPCCDCNCLSQSVYLGMLVNSSSFPHVIPGNQHLPVWHPQSPLQRKTIYAPLHLLLSREGQNNCSWKPSPYKGMLILSHIWASSQVGHKLRWHQAGPIHDRKHCPRHCWYTPTLAHCVQFVPQSVWDLHHCTPYPVATLLYWWSDSVISRTQLWPARNALHFTARNVCTLGVRNKIISTNTKGMH